jgi:hypothetical protein
VDPRAGLDNVEKIKFLTLPGLELYPSAVQPVASRYIISCTTKIRVYEPFFFCLEDHYWRYVRSNIRKLANKVHLLYEPWYVVSSVGNFAEGKSKVVEFESPAAVLIPQQNPKSL